MKATTPTREECLRILNDCGCPENVIAHAVAVERKAAELAARFPDADSAVIHAAALLHDAKRAEKNHPKAAADMVEEMGFPKVAEAIRFHHDLPEDASIEAKITALADRLTDGDKPTTIEERFKKSAKKCVTDEAKKAHERRYIEAMKLELFILGDSR